MFEIELSHKTIPIDFFEKAVVLVKNALNDKISINKLRNEYFKLFQEYEKQFTSKLFAETFLNTLYLLKKNAFGDIIFGNN